MEKTAKPEQHTLILLEGVWEILAAAGLRVIQDSAPMESAAIPHVTLVHATHAHLLPEPCRMALVLY
jgi:hypothetical protein